MGAIPGCQSEDFGFLKAVAEAPEDGDVRPESEERGVECEAEERIAVEADEVDVGARNTIKMNDPKEPTEREKLDHELTHLPYRSWCRHCVRGRGKAAVHKKQADSGILHELHFDFAFLGDEDRPGECVTMLVVREKLSGMTMSSAIPTKSTGKFVVARVLAFMKELGLGHSDVIAKSDQEPAAKRLLDEIGKQKAEIGGAVDRGAFAGRCQREQWSSGESDTERQRASAGVEELLGGQVGREDRVEACGDSMDDGVRGALAESLRGEPRWQDRVRAQQR